MLSGSVLLLSKLIQDHVAAAIAAAAAAAEAEEAVGLGHACWATTELSGLSSAHFLAWGRSSRSKQNLPLFAPRFSAQAED